jgi:hypothetical protein
MLTRRGVVVENTGQTHPADPDAEGQEAAAIPGCSHDLRHRLRTRVIFINSMPMASEPAGKDRV